MLIIRDILKIVPESFYDKAEEYSHEIFQSYERNIERICESNDVPTYITKCKMHHLISDSNWNARAVIDQIAIQVSGLLPLHKLTGLIIDEPGVLKI